MARFTSAESPCAMYLQFLAVFFAQLNPPPSCGSIFPLWKYPPSFAPSSVCILQRAAHHSTPLQAPHAVFGSTGVCTFEPQDRSELMRPHHHHHHHHQCVWSLLRTGTNTIFFGLFWLHYREIVLIPEEEFSIKVRCGSMNTGSLHSHQNSSASPEVISTGSFLPHFHLSEKK